VTASPLDLELTEDEITDLVTRYLAVWTESDAARRTAAVAGLWAPDAIHLPDPGAEFSGLAELDRRVTGAHEQFAGTFAVTAADDARGHHDCVVFTIQLESGGEVAWAARAVLQLDENGRIRRDYHFTVKRLAS
jgi:ketosteroid isomerase-like protein